MGAARVGTHWKSVTSPRPELAARPASTPLMTGPPVKCDALGTPEAIRNARDGTRNGIPTGLSSLSTRPVSPTVAIHGVSVRV